MVINGKKATLQEWKEMVELYRQLFIIRNGKSGQWLPRFELQAGDEKADASFEDGVAVISFIGEVVTTARNGNNIRATDTDEGLLDEFVEVYQTIIGPAGYDRKVFIKDLPQNIYRELCLETGDEFDQFFTEVSKMAV